VGRAYGHPTAALGFRRGLWPRRSANTGRPEDPPDESFVWPDAAYLERCSQLPRDDRYDFISHRFSGSKYDFEYDSLRIAVTLATRTFVDDSREWSNLAVGRRPDGDLTFIVFDYNEIPTMVPVGGAGGDIYFRYEGREFAHACDILTLRLQPERAATFSKRWVHDEIAAKVAAAGIPA